VWQLKWELEDLAFKYLYPGEYEQLAAEVAKSRGERLEYIHHVEKLIHKEMTDHGVPCEVMGRAKHLWSIYQKMKRTQRPFEEIHDAIAKGFTTYGMQTFDQSLMSLVRQSIITYEEAHRQASNPDDFALRFSGISATSDARWDDFEGGSDGNSAPGSVAFAQRGSPSAPAPAAAPRPPLAGGPTTPLGKINPNAPRPGAAPAQKPAAGGSTGLPSADDDFHIERF